MQFKSKEVIYLDQKVLKLFKEVNDRINEESKKINQLMEIINEKNKSDLEYMAMMTDIDLDSSDNDISEE